jgi:glycosylphosphatidylinositol transamidase (GPIT) subunit GPI8
MMMKVYSPNVLGVGSSLIGEDSLSVRDTVIGINA